MKIRKPNPPQSLWMVCAITILAGCASQVDLQAVQKYAQATADAGASFSAVASGYYASCLRRRELNLPRDQWAKVFTKPYTAASPQPAPSITPPAGPENDPKCENASRVSTAWDSGNKIVLNYVHALGAAASVDVQPTFQPLTDALVSANALPQSAEQPILNLASALSKIVISGDVRADIANAVSTANPSMKDATDGLTSVSRAYNLYLKSEFDDTDKYYYTLVLSECQAALASSSGKKAPYLPSTLTISSCGVLPYTTPSLHDEIFLQRQRWNNTIASINQNIAANEKYAEAVDAIERTHEHLYEATQRKLGIQDYITILQRDVMPLYQDAEDLRKVTQ